LEVNLTELPRLLHGGESVLIENPKQDHQSGQSE
jgi:hypothetical protein